MADYYPLLAKAVASLDPNTRDARKGIFDRARSALNRQFASMDPPADKAILDRELLALETVIERVEAEQRTAMRTDAETEVSAMGEVPLAPIAKPRPQISAQQKHGAKNRKPMIAVGLSLGVIAVMAIATLAFLRRDQPPALASRPATAVQQPFQPNVVQAKPVDRVVTGPDQPASSPPQASSPASGITQPGIASAPRPQSTVPQSTVPQSTVPVVPQSPPGAASTPPGLPVVAPSPPALAVANRMLLLLQGTEQGQQTVVKQGSVVWRTEVISGGQGQPLLQAIKAGVDVPETNLRSDITIQRNRDPAFPASHTIQIAFSSVGKSELGPIQTVIQIELRQVENQVGYALAGQGIAVVENLFLVALAQAEPARSNNEDMLKSRPYIFIEFVTTAGRRGAMLIEKGVSGQQAFDDAFRSWQ
ncbi:MAG: hypothetical protein ACKVON_15500 [Beijerinckiaceae bacterium]